MRKVGYVPLTWRLVAAISIVSIAVLTATAMAQPLPFDGQRSAQWYADHPVERAQTRRACLTDPSRLGPTTDCVNANRGDAADALRRGSAGQNMSLPSSPDYWTQRPADRAVKLAYCSRMTPEHQARADCGPARDSLVQEQQRGNRN